LDLLFDIEIVIQIVIALILNFKSKENTLKEGFTWI